MTSLVQPQTQTVPLADGRKLAYVETGDPGGAPVIAFHGLPGSRLQRHPDESIARAARLRIIHLDRPGFGLSSPQPGRKLTDWPRAVAQVADAIGLEHFAIAGVSGGGPYAAACVASLGKRVTRAAIVSSVGPPGSMNGRMTISARLGFLAASRAKWALKAPIAVAARLAMRAPLRYIDLLAWHMSPADRPILARQDVRAMLAEDLRESFRQGVNALVDDLTLLANPWSFEWERIACPIALWHGEDDWLVPPGATRCLEQVIPRARTRLLPGEGHFLIFDRWPEICEWLSG